jgi:hypothetical protein
MTRKFAPTLFSLVLAFLTIGAAAGPAMAAGASSGAYYRAQPAAAPPAAQLVVRDLVWNCGADGCVAGRSTSRAATDCSALARQVGALRSFTVEGRALAPDELEKCNARAR